jgi:hypothetical protein
MFGHMQAQAGIAGHFRGVPGQGFELPERDAGFRRFQIRFHQADALQQECGFYPALFRMPQGGDQNQSGDGGACLHGP